jgi:hypothetical protein
VYVVWSSLFRAGPSQDNALHGLAIANLSAVVVDATFAGAVFNIMSKMQAAMTRKAVPQNPHIRTKYATK